MKLKNIKFIFILFLLFTLPLSINTPKDYHETPYTSFATRKIRTISTPSLSSNNIKELSGLQTIMNIPHPIAITDFNGNLVRANKSFKENFNNKNKSNITNKPITKFLNLEGLKTIFSSKNPPSLSRNQLGNTEGSNETMYKTQISYVYDNKGNKRGFYFELFDNSEAMKDSLTGAYNRTVFNDKFKKEIVRAQRNGPVSLLMMDLDKFKSVNDTYGHLTGDEVLQGTIQATKKCIREMDTLARWAGDEFGVILPKTNTEEALSVAKRIKKRINQRIERILKDKQSINKKRKDNILSSISIGIGTYEGESYEGESYEGKNTPDSSEIAEILTNEADRALNDSKQEGRNKITTYNDID